MAVFFSGPHCVSTLGSIQICCHLRDEIFKNIFLNENCVMLIRNAPEFLPNSPINSTSAFDSGNRLAPNRTRHNLNQWRSQWVHLGFFSWHGLQQDVHNLHVILLSSDVHGGLPEVIPVQNVIAGQSCHQEAGDPRPVVLGGHVEWCHTTLVSALCRWRKGYYLMRLR